MKEKIDIQLIMSILNDITNFMEILQKHLHNKVEDKKIKHLAASSIHLVYFVRDLYEEKYTDEENDLIKQFLEKCGCK